MMYVNLATSIIISAVVKQKDKGKKEVTESEEENCNCVKSLHGSSELMLCWTM
jgi:hypothetical protein